MIRFVERECSRHSGVIVDLGCGQGYLLHMLSRLKTSTCTVGVDWSRALLGKAKTILRHSNVELVQADAHFLPFRSNSVDLLCLCEVIEHVGNPALAVKDMKRVLSTTGRIMLSFPNAFSFYPSYYFIRKFGTETRRCLLHALRPLAIRALIPYEDLVRTGQPEDHAYTYCQIISIFGDFVLIARDALYNGTRFRVEFLMHVLRLHFEPFYYRCFLAFGKRQP